MAKKNLINADMLLATPRKMIETEPSLSTAEEPFKLTIHEIIDLTGADTESTQPPPAIPSVKRGLKNSETRATFIVDEGLLEKLKAVAYWERLNIKEVIHELFHSYLSAYEKQNGPIKAIPNNRKV